MAHQEQIEFCCQVKNLYPDYFNGVYVLDAGSLDINGNNRYLFTNSHYIGVDIGEGENVDIVSKIHELKLPDNAFDTIISTEVFEHDKHYPDSIKNIYRMLKPGGMFLFTCATTGRPEHGTNRVCPLAAPLLQNIEEWQDYYKNLTEKDIREIFDLDEYFSEYQFIVNPNNHDLYFWGIKSGVWHKENDRSCHIATPVDKKYAQLFIDIGSGFNDNESIIVYYDKNQSKVSFDLKGYENIRSLRFHPLSEYMVVWLGGIFINGLKYNNNLNTNAFYNKDDIYYFLTKDPNIFLDIDNLQDIKNVSFELKYLYIDDDSIRLFSNIFFRTLQSMSRRILGLNQELQDKDQEIQSLNMHIECLKEELTLIKAEKTNNYTDKDIRKS